MPAPKNNKFAAKREADKRTSRLVVPMTRREKSRLVKDAGGRKLTDYVREKLM